MDKEEFNSEDIKKLRSLIGKTRQANLKKALVDLKAGKSLTKAQLKGLEEFDEALKGMQDYQETPPVIEEIHQFSNLRHVLVYLLERGYKVSESNLYKHGKEGKIRPSPDGNYTLKTVKTYASTFLRTMSTHLTEKADELQRKYEKARLRNMQIKNKQDARKLAIQEGKYILRTL